MSDDELAWKLNADPKRQATDSLRGYVYQAWQTLHAWLELSGDQLLYLEGAEDFDIIDPQSGTPVQVKDTAGNVTLRTESVIDAIASYWRLRQSHPDKKISFTFLTRSSVGGERGAPFGKGNKGLALWHQCRGDEASVKKIAEFLCGDEVIRQSLPEDLLTFLGTESPGDIYNLLISPMNWLTEAPLVEAVTAAIERKLITHGNSFGVPPSECIKVTDRLLREVLTVASRKEYENRHLDYSDFALIFEEATSVCVPRHNLKHLQTIQGLECQVLTGLYPGAPVSFQPLVHVLSPGPPPPLTPKAAPRIALVQRCQTILSDGGILNIRASTGMGKTTLAKLTARAQGGEWAWFSFSPFHDERFIWALAQVSQLVDELPRNSNVVLDDIQFEAGTVNGWEQIFAGLSYTLKARQISLITTSLKSVPLRVKNLLGPVSLSEVMVYGFDESEIESLCLRLGCPKERGAVQAKITYLHTSGHPQLVHARLLTLSRQGWPKISTDSLLSTPEDIKEHQQQARQLLDDLDDEEAELLYLASVASPSFRREYVIQLGENAGFSRPGAIFDRLVGPWIERTAGGRFELSPLLKNAGNEVWPRTKIENIHSQLADAILSGRELTTLDGSYALFHAYIGNNRQALSWLCISLMTKVSGEIQKSFGENAFWFLNVDIEENSGALYKDDQNLNFLLRMTQFRLQVATEPQEAQRILVTWEREVNQLDRTLEGLVNRVLFYITALLQCDVPLRPLQVFRFFREYSAIRQEIMASGDSELKDLLPLGQIDWGGGQGNLLAILFAVNGLRCRNQKDLDEYLQGLSGLPCELRQELLGAFDLSEGYAASYVDSAFLYEVKVEEPDFEGCLEVLYRAVWLAEEWGSPSLGASAVRTAAIILDEYLEQREEAIAVLDRGVEQFPSHSWVIDGYRGTILLHHKCYEEAVAVFTRALEGCDDRREVFSSPIFTFRNAGVAAAHIDKWDLAAEFFLRGYHSAVRLNNEVLAAAFQSDAAYAYWKAGCLPSVLKSFRCSIALIDDMDRDKGDLGITWVFRTTAHILSWVRSVIENGQPQAELTTPFAGMCSTPERNEQILALPEIPFEISLYFLIRLEHVCNAEPIALELYGGRLDDSRIPAIEMFMAPLHLQQAFLSGSLGRLPVVIDKLLCAYVATRKLMEDRAAPWGSLDEAVSELQVRQACLKDDFLEGPFLAALVRICHTDDPDCLRYVNQWRCFADDLSWRDELIDYLNRVEKFQGASARELSAVFLSNETNVMDLHLVSLFVTQKVSEVAPFVLLQAHVYLLDKFSQTSTWGKYIEEALSRMIASGWAEKAKARFALCSPQLTVPELENACSIKLECFGKSAAVLLAAATAIGSRLPQAVAERYLSLRDSMSKEA